MKKIAIFLFAVVAFCSCKKEDLPLVPPPVNPIETRMKISGTFDFIPFDFVSSVGVSLILSRNGFEILSGKDIYSQNSNSNTFSFYLDKSLDSLKGSAHELMFVVRYSVDGVGYSANIIKSFVFSDKIDVGNVGFPGYNWFAIPRPKIAIPATGEIYYYQTK